MDILLTNIGNRNITYQGKTYNELEISQKPHQNYTSFRDWTKSLLENIYTEKEFLDINIINPLIQSSSKFNLIVIYYSDQSEFNTRTDQDTIHEAAIMEYLLIEKYSHEPSGISKVKVDAKVIDNGALLNFYRLELVKFKKINSSIFVTICDAGGTAQQKMALKVMAEFVLKPDEYRVFYMEKNSLITDVNINEYRKVINFEQSIALIHQGEYLAAAELLDISIENHQNTKYNWQQLVFLHTFFRFINNRKLATFVTNKLFKIKNPIIISYKNGEAFAENPELSEGIGMDNYMDVTDMLYKAIFYYNIKKFSLSILAFAHFYERFLHISFSTYYDSALFGTRYNQTPEQNKSLVSEVETYYENFLKQNPNFRIQVDSIMVQILLLKVCENCQIKKVASVLSPYFSHTEDSLSNIKHINSVRNDIAHNGTLISSNEMHIKLPYYNDLLNKMSKIFGLKSNSMFFDLNSIIENILRS